MEKFNNLIKVFLFIIFLFPISCIDKPLINNTHKVNNDSIKSIMTDSIQYTDTLNTDTLNQGIIFGANMYNVYEKEFTKEQFDSICKADLLINNLSKWHQLSMRDGETNQIVVEYMFIKSLGSYECIYRLVKTNDNIYKITKRIKK